MTLILMFKGQREEKSGESASASETTTILDEDISPVSDNAAPDENRESALKSEDAAADRKAQLPSASINTSANRNEESVNTSYEIVPNGRGLSGQVTQASEAASEIPTQHSTGNDSVTSAEDPPDNLIITKF